ncbi:G-protein coupled receptor 55 [Periophthalmus magnuspinnatus]|uniref:G-protein coupled receptor 55 n=1 Tax=Periophthalmus magnuspinnatus TaxID=409849 RepID=UPI0024364814|nr:G-protein coupled receptor 55 [Periophthalmus magnuspinnatus]
MCMNTTSSECKMDTLQGVGYTLLFIPGILLHIAAFCAFRLCSWTDTHIYMFNLALADSTLILFLPFRIYDAFRCLPKNSLCMFLFNFHFLNMYASILTTAAVSVHRYLAVRFPMQARSWSRKKETAIAVCFIIWGLLITVCAVFREENSPDKLWTCYERRKDKPLSLVFILLLLLLGYFLPLLTIVFCSSQIIYILFKLNDETQEKKGIIGIVTANLVVFVVCFTPINVSYIVNYLSKPPADWQCRPMLAHTYLIVSEWIASTNCCFDSISYYFLLKHFYSQQ